MKKLNLGCGNVKMSGYINVDNDAGCQPDVVHDLNKFPYPFSDNEFDGIYLDHVIEHLNDPISVLQELHRISRGKGKITIKCPHFSCAWLHPGHKSAISISLFDFAGRSSDGVSNFKLEKVKIYWIRNRKDYLEGRSFLVKISNSIINFLANLNPGVAERVWCYWVGGFEEIHFETETVKNQI